MKEKSAGISGEQLLECAVHATRQAGSHAMANHNNRRQDFVHLSKHDIKLVLDVECQKIAFANIAEFFPDHAFLGEEDTDSPASEGVQSEYEWIVDPIDGTVNFSHGMSRWCCSVAVRRNGVTLAGAVYAPEFDKLYTATADGPALLNGNPIAVSEIDNLSNAVIFTGLDKQADLNAQTDSSSEYVLEKFTRIAAAVQRPRVMGCAALDLCEVAAGHAEGYFESGIYLWDVAAAGLIVERAGGFTSILAGFEGYRMSFLAGNRKIHDALRKLLT